MNVPERFISCDWGTSNFRLRLVDTNSLNVLAEHKTDMGIKKRFQDFKMQNGVSQEVFFAEYLKEQISALNYAKGNNLVVVASGMLSSSIGMRELPYAKMPIAFDGKDLISTSIHRDNGPKIILVSGVRTATDVMRGEEIQAMGLANHLPKEDRGILLLPGTHSKHITFEKGRFEDFTTYMTGELFEIISKTSILAASLNQVDWNSSFQPAFLEGVKKGISNQQMASLFAIRASSLISNTAPEQNYFFLSGLLIGGELANLKDKNETVYLAASGIYNVLYELALRSFLPKKRVVCFETQIIEKALLIGQRKILESYG